MKSDAKAPSQTRRLDSIGRSHVSLLGDEQDLVLQPCHHRCTLNLLHQDSAHTSRCETLVEGFGRSQSNLACEGYQMRVAE